MRSYRDLDVWQKSIQLVVEVYKVIKLMPNDEKFGLTSQIKRAAVSIPSNIAEGQKRSSRKSFCNFLYNAYGSGAELETQLEIIKRLNLLKSDQLLEINKLLSDVMRMLNKLIKSLDVRR